MPSDFASALTDFGGAVSDLFSAKGATASASSYSDAAAIAEQNAQLAKSATAIQEIQLSRQIYKTTGKQIAQVGGAGFAESGTAIDLLRSSISEGALTKAITAQQGAITENSYAEQAGLYTGLAASGKSAATGATIGGILQGAGGALNLAKGASNLFSASSAATDATAAGAAADASVAGFGTVADAAAAGVSDIGVGVAAADIAAPAVAADAFGVADFISTAAWIICTELRRQGRMPARTYYLAAPEFAAYSERGKRGYYVWAIPSTRHLRAHPQSWYSRLLERTFNCRARYIANRKRGLPGTLAGALVTHGLYGFCWMLSWFVPASFARWQTLYRT